MSKYKELDAKLVELIFNGCGTFAELSGRCKSLSAPFSKDQSNHWRIVDRRLQALRKAGVIVFIKGQWWVVAGLGGTP